MKYVIPFETIIRYITDCFPYRKTTHDYIKKHIAFNGELKFLHHTYVFEGDNISYNIKGYVFEANFHNNFNCPCRQKIILLRDLRSNNLHIDIPMPSCNESCLKSLSLKIIKIVVDSRETKVVCKDDSGEEFFFFLKIFH